MKLPDKIPILWRVERFFKKMAEDVKAEKDEEKGYKEELPYGFAYDPRHQRMNGMCDKCGNNKFFKRKNNKKCTRCGTKQKC